MLALVAALAAALACTQPAPHLPRAVSALVPLGSAVLARSAEGPAAHIGGLSGLEFDAARGRWWALSDDRGAPAPARLYELQIPLGASGPGTPQVLGWLPLRRPDGDTFALPGAPGEPADAEALRLDPCRDEWLWASEGEPLRGHPAFVRRAARDGRFLGELALPPLLAAFDGERGPRPNLSFEGLAFTPDGAHLWLALEAPLMQDGAVPTAGHGALLRFTRFARTAEGFAPQAQFAYPVEPTTHEASGGRQRADNGVSEILALDADTLLVIERSGREVGDGVFAFTARLWLARSEGAEDIGALPTLAGAAVRTMHKRLLLDLAQAGLGLIDNIEGAAWGPRLPDGRATLLLVSDDNFSPHQRTQWLLFAVQER